MSVAHIMVLGRVDVSILQKGLEFGGKMNETGGGKGKMRKTLHHKLSKIPQIAFPGLTFFFRPVFLRKKIFSETWVMREMHKIYP